jgi:hypothetical protein
MLSRLAADGCAEASVFGIYLLTILEIAPPAGYQLPPVLAVAMDSRRLSAPSAGLKLPAVTNPMTIIERNTMVVIFLIFFLLLSTIKFTFI